MPSLFTSLGGAAGIASAPIGPETQVNTYTNGDQDKPTIENLLNGNFVVTWQTGNPEGHTEIRAQLFSVEGVKIGAELLVNAPTQASLFQPAATSLAAGGFVVSWAELTSSQSVKAQVFDAEGNKVGNEFQVDLTATGVHDQPTITGLSTGGFVVSWRDNDSDSSGIKAQIFDGTGGKLGAEFFVNTTTVGPQFEPAITSLANGGFVVSWTDASGVGSDTSAYGVKAQIFGPSGDKTGSEFLVNTITFAHQVEPTLTGLSNGGFVVSWTDLSHQGGDASERSVKAQIFDAAGGKVGTEFLVNTQTSSYQFEPTIASLSNGGFIVSWADLSGVGGDASTYGIKAQVFDALGGKVGEEFLVNTTTIGSQRAPAVIELDTGGFVVSWEDRSYQGEDSSGSGIKMQVFGPVAVNAAPVLTGMPGTLVNGTANTAYIVTATSLLEGYTDAENDQLSVVGLSADHGVAVDNGDGTYSITPTAGYFGPLTISYGVTDGRGAATAASLQLVLFQVSANGSILGTAQGDDVVGTSASDTIFGMGGDDRLNGMAGADKMYGGLGNDTYVVESLTDRIFESNNQGIDTVVTGMSYALTGLYVENLTVSGTGNFAVGGNGFANVLIGNSGNNTINGGLNGDTMSGGAGNDLYFVDHVGDVVIELANQGKDAVNASITYTLTDNVETLALTGFQAINGTGNALDNTMTGNGNANQLNGGDGKDLLIGQGGNDILTGGAGADSFRFYRAGALNGLDHLTDFVSGTDKLQLTGADYGFAKGQVLTAAQLHTGGSVGAFGQFLYNIVNHTLYWDADGTGATAAVALAVFDNSAQPVAGDFVFL